MKNYILPLIAVLIFSGCLKDENIIDKSSGDVSNSQVVLNEILPTTSASWLELYNPTGQEIDLSSYTVSNTGSSYEIPASTIIAANSYLAIICDGQNMLDENGYLHSNFIISEKNDAILLKDEQDKKIEEVFLPELAYGISWAKLRSSTITWQQFIPTFGDYNNPQLKAAVIESSHSPVSPTHIDKTNVSAKTAKLIDIQAVVIHYEENESNSSEFSVMAPGGETYDYLIPKFPTGTTVSYYFEVIDINGKKTVYPQNAPEEKIRYLVENYGPYISSIAATPVSPTDQDPVTITAIITDKTVIDEACVVYVDPAGHTDIAIPMGNTGNVYTAQIPAFSNNSVVYYYIKARSDSNITSFFPEGAPNTKLSYTISN